MPSLWLRSLGSSLSRKDRLTLAVLAVILLLLVADVFRPPSSQIIVRAFAAAVDGYHHSIHPFTGQYIRCHYQPTCSHYAVEAAQKYGMVKGGWMGFRRLLSCKRSVPMGTIDPVP